MKRILLLLLFGLPSLTGCSSVPSVDFWPNGIAQHNGQRYSLIGLAVATPPLNNVIFGPCEDEFAMPDSRRGNCNFYHFVRGRQSPWAQNAAAAQLSGYASQDLYCQRTIGGISDCTVARGTPHAPNLNAPTMGAN